MSYIHKTWVIDGWTDWLVHAFGKGVSEYSFTVNNNWTGPNIKLLRHLGSFPWVACRKTRDGRRYDTPLYSLTSVWSSYLSVLLAPLPSSSPPIDLSPGTPEAIRRCWLVSLSLAWSVLSILVNSDASHTFSYSPTLQLSLPSFINPLSSFPVQSLSLITHSDTLFSLSFPPHWIFSSLYCVVYHVLLSCNAQGPLSNIDSCFLEMLLFLYILSQCIYSYWNLLNS